MTWENHSIASVVLSWVWREEACLDSDRLLYPEPTLTEQPSFLPASLPPSPEWRLRLCSSRHLPPMGSSLPRVPSHLWRTSLQRTLMM